MTTFQEWRKITGCKGKGKGGGGIGYVCDCKEVAWEMSVVMVVTT